METEIVVALIGAVAAMAAAVLPNLIKHCRRNVGARPEKNEPTSLDLATSLREHENVRRLLQHASCRNAAEAAIAYFANGQECSVPSWMQSSTWEQVRLASEELKRDSVA